MKQKRLISNILVFTFLTLAALFTLFPLLMALVNSFKTNLKEKGIFDVVNGVLVGKPQDEAYYEEYKNILVKVINNEKFPIVFNVNFGHATPRCVLQYGIEAKVDMKQKKIYLSR